MSRRMTTWSRSATQEHSLCEEIVMPDETKEKARRFLTGRKLSFTDADKLWRDLKRIDELSLAREVLAQIRGGSSLLAPLTAARAVRQHLCREHALLTSKDPELGCAGRHDQALQILAEMFDLDDTQLDGDTETLGIAGGIYKRRWNDLGQLDDLLRSAAIYERGAKGELGCDAYTQINAAFVFDLLAAAGVAPATHRERARLLRGRIVDELAPHNDTWFNVASRAEALFGLGQYAQARDVIAGATTRPEPWHLQTLVQQLGTLARLHDPKPLSNPAIREVFEAILPGAAQAFRSAVAGKLGLALSGGGFRAAFYHLGLLARLAELDALRHIEVLSCVSGGSIVGACYWLALRARMLDSTPMVRDDYVRIVREVIGRFERSVAMDLRDAIQPSKVKAIWRMVRNEKGVLDPERAAAQLQEHFYAELMPGSQTIYMHDLHFTPADHEPAFAGPGDFNPRRHNWARSHKVPALILNATTVNTAHAWQFTPTWMGESPWAIHEAADSIPRLEWSRYEERAGWQIALGRAVAASACVPGVFAPLVIDGAYPGIDVQLVDGGVHDNQGTVSLLAQNCNVLLVSDASGQLLLEKSPGDGISGLGSYAFRAMNILMERVRLANYEDLNARRHSGLLRGLVFLHMKAGLDADTRRLRFSQESFELARTTLSPSGVRKDFQQALAELRTDLDAFTEDESRSLMACGYQMACTAFENELPAYSEILEAPLEESWCFAEHLREITSTEATTPRRDGLLDNLRSGSKVRV
jgi:predicted acylesterase/phospholipase RssA